MNLYLDYSYCFCQVHTQEILQTNKDKSLNLFHVIS